MCPRGGAMALDKISVVGAREHNLKNISLEIPRDKFVVITGLSGSGKSSLAFGSWKSLMWTILRGLVQQSQ